MSRSDGASTHKYQDQMSLQLDSAGMEAAAPSQPGWVRLRASGQNLPCDSPSALPWSAGQLGLDHAFSLA